METVLCAGHDMPCYLKTGVKEGPSYGKSFYICSNGSDRCDYVKEASGLAVQDCPMHAGNTVELQAVHTSQSTGDSKQYYRCVFARKDAKKWCGHSSSGASKPKKSPQPLKSWDKNVQHVREEKMSKKSDKSSPKKTDEVVRQKPDQKKATGSAMEKAKDQPQHKQLEKLKPKSFLNESFESLAQKARSKMPVEQAPNLNDSHRSFRNNTSVVTVRSDSDDSSDEEYEDSVQEIGSAATAEPYRDTSVVAISSDSEDDDDDDYKSADEAEKVTSKQTVEEAQKKTSNENSTGKTTTFETVIRPDGTKVIKIKGPNVSQVKPAATSQPQPKVVTTAPATSGNQQAPVTMVNSQGPAKSLVASSEATSNLLKYTKQKGDMSKLLDHQKTIMQKVDLAALPDKGARIKSQVDHLTHQISQLDIKINSAKKDVLAQHQAANGGAKPKVIVVGPHPSASQSSSVSGQVLPPGVKQTKLTDHGVISKLPPHVLQQMYAANPQMNNLYGGRMTKARLHEVGTVTSEAIENLHKQMDSMPDSQKEATDPDGLEVPLMLHQRQALCWLAWRERQHPAGGILADDMGLGKTLTMISHVVQQNTARDDHKKETKGEDDEEWLKKSAPKVQKSGATLIVCPASLVHQWDREITRRCESGLLKVILYHGPNREKDVRKLVKADIVLTTYNLISREVGVPDDMKKDKSQQDMAAKDQELRVGDSGLLSVAWERIILDEAHNIKNHKSLTAMSVCRLRARYRWALTGTPIQNDLLDMYSLLRFLRCSPFDEYKLWKRQVDNKSAKGTQRLNMLVKTLLLRRTKDQTNKEGKKLVSLPEKANICHELTLLPGERAVYNRIYEQSRATLQNYLQRHEDKEREKDLKTSGNGNNSNNPWAKDDTLGGTANRNAGFQPASQVAQGAANQKQQQPGGGQILLLLLRLRQCCGHLSLMKDALDLEGLETDGLDLDIVEQMQELALKEGSDPQEPEVNKRSRLFEVDTRSTKIDALMKEMRQIRDDSDKKDPMKSVIVSQWTKMLDVVEHHLKEAGFRCCTIKGNVPPKTRAEMVDAFNMDPKGPEIMLVSLRAGGVGLNLIGGNHLFVIDMHWNPALEQQACDRIYRVGQKRDVRIHRFICKETIEEKILELQKKKLSLAKNVLTVLVPPPTS